MGVPPESFMTEVGKPLNFELAYKIAKQKLKIFFRLVFHTSKALGVPPESFVTEVGEPLNFELAYRMAKQKLKLGVQTEVGKP